MMFYIQRPTQSGFETWHKRRQVWQWFYDSSNRGWKTRGGAERALTKLAKRYPFTMKDAVVISYPITT